MAWVVGAAAATGRVAHAASRWMVQVAAGYAANPLTGVGRLVTGGTNGALPPYDENRYRFPIGVTVLWVVLALALLTLLVG
jgi:hypothetical protein